MSPGWWRPEEPFQLRPEALGDRRRQVVAKAVDDHLGRVLDVQPTRRERPERGDEQPEREDREQEAVRDLGRQAGDVVGLDALHEPPDDVLDFFAGRRRLLGVCDHRHGRSLPRDGHRACHPVGPGSCTRVAALCDHLRDAHGRGVRRGRRDLRAVLHGEGRTRGRVRDRRGRATRPRWGPRRSPPLRRGAADRRHPVPDRVDDEELHRLDDPDAARRGAAGPRRRRGVRTSRSSPAGGPGPRTRRRSRSGTS